MSITQKEFEKLPRKIQNLRWKLFVETNGYQDPTKFNSRRIKRVMAVLKELQQAGDNFPSELYAKLAKKTG
jgi:hypothetical protein